MQAIAGRGTLGLGAFLKNLTFSLPTTAMYYLLLSTHSGISRPRGGIFRRSEILRFSVSLRVFVVFFV